MSNFGMWQYTVDREATALACGYAGPAPYMNDGLRGDAAGVYAFSKKIRDAISYLHVHCGFRDRTTIFNVSPTSYLCRPGHYHDNSPRPIVTA